jgi:hypothetical protein
MCSFVTIADSGLKHFFSVFAFTLLFLSCSDNGLQEARLKTLDSLSGALNQKLVELKQVDTVILQKALSKYSNYRQFIQQNVDDTLKKEEADHLQQFYGCGKNLLDFSVNRKSILARGALIDSQLNKLILDIKENAADQEKVSEFTSKERTGAEQLIKISFGQQQLFLTNLQEFKLSVSGVEKLIRSRNSGRMPTVIKDSIPL